MTTQTQTQPTTTALKPVTPKVELCEYDQDTGTGIISIDGVRHVLLALRDRATRKIYAMRFQRYCERREVVRMIDVDITSKPWTCDCEDATYRPERPGGCKHVVALREAAQFLRCRKAVVG